MGNRNSLPTVPCPVDAAFYDVTYFLGECEGYQEFITYGGRTLSNRLATALRYADVRPGMRVLDIGCGRGEVLVWLRRQGAEAWGLDYAPDALRLTITTLAGADPGQTQSNVRVLAANARHLPFYPESFDHVLMLDIVEHLHPWELDLALREVWRVLKWDGKLLVHTAPNRWYYQFGYPLFRTFERLRGISLPKDPRQRFRSHQYVHVNEQSPRSLARSLQQAGFQPQIWLADTQRRWADQGRLTYMLGWLVTHCPPCTWIFCGDILGVAHKV